MTARNTTSKYFLLALVLLLSYFSVSIARQGYLLFRVHRETVKTQARVEKLKQENAALEQEKENLGDIHYIEKVARDEHNMVGKDEIPLFMLDDKQDKQTSAKK